MHTIIKTFSEYPFAHRQWTHKGHCALIHGHNWKFEVKFTCDKLDENGFVIDFGDMHSFKEYLRKNFDHTLVLAIDDPRLVAFEHLPVNLVKVHSPSAEGLAKEVFNEFSDLLTHEQRKRGCRIISVTVHEDSKNSATYQKYG